MKVTISKRKAAAGAVCACALVACLGASAAFAAGSGATAAADVDENVPTSVTTTTGDYIKGAATRAAGPALEILGLASVEESGQFVNTDEWYDWSYPKYYLCASDYNTALSPFLANLATGTGTDEYPSAVLNSSRAGGGSGPNASLEAYGGDDESDQAVWALGPDVVVGTGGGVDYPDGVEGVEYSFSDYTDLVATMDAIAEAADAADANVSSRTLRYGSASDIAQDYEEYIFGTIGAVAEAIADEDNAVEKRTVALVESVSTDGATGENTYNLMTTTDAENDGTASTNRYLEATSDNGLGDALDLAENLANTKETVSASDLEAADLILVGGQQSSSNYDSIVKALFEDGLLADTYFVEDNGSAGAMYGVVMNSVENAQNIGRILGCLYPEVVDQQDWLAYYYETFYHIDSSKLATVMDSALDGVRCWGVGEEALEGTSSYSDAIGILCEWEVSGTGYTIETSADSVAATIAAGYGYYQGAAGEADSQDASDAAATAQLATASTTSTLSTASLSTLDTDTDDTDTDDTAIWTVTDSSGTETSSYSTFGDITLASGDTVKLNADATDDISVSLSDDDTDDSYTIDLAGHTLTGTVTAALNGTLNITSSTEEQGEITYSLIRTSTYKYNEGTVACSKGTLVLDNIYLYSFNSAYSTSYYCAAIYLSGGSLKLTDTTVLEAPEAGGYSDLKSPSATGGNMQALALLMTGGTLEMENSTLATKAEEGGLGTGGGNLYNVRCTGGTFTASSCEFEGLVAEDVCNSSSLYTYAAYFSSAATSASFENCTLSATCHGETPRRAITLQCACPLSLDSCELVVDAPDSSLYYPASLTTTATAGTVSLSGDLLFTGGNVQITAGDVVLMPGLTLSELIVMTAWTSDFAFALGTTTSEDESVTTWTVEDAESLALSMTTTDESSHTYCGEVLYEDEDDATLPTSIGWQEASSTTVTADGFTTCAGVEDYTPSATLLAAGLRGALTAVEDPELTYAYYSVSDVTVTTTADESTDESSDETTDESTGETTTTYTLNDDAAALESAPTEAGTYYYTASFAGDYDEVQLASESGLAVLTINEDHSYDDEPTIVWADDYTATLVSVCSVCGHEKEETVTVTVTTDSDGSTVFTATATYDDKTYTDSKTISAPTETSTADATVSVDDSGNITVSESDSTDGSATTSYADAIQYALITVTDESGNTTTTTAAVSVADDGTITVDTSAVTASTYTITIIAEGYEDIVSTVTVSTTTADDGTTTTQTSVEVTSGTVEANTTSSSSSGSSGSTSGSGSSGTTTTAKKANTLTVKAKAVSVKGSYDKKKKTNKKAIAVTASKFATVSKAQGKVTYKLAKKVTGVTMTSTGKITLAKGKFKKGKTVTLKVTVTAAGNSSYNAGSKTITVKIKLK